MLLPSRPHSHLNTNYNFRLEEKHRDLLPLLFFAVFDVGSKRKAGGGGRFSKLPIELKWPELAVFVMEEVRRIGGGGLFACMELRRSNVARIVPVLMAIETIILIQNRKMRTQSIYDRNFYLDKTNRNNDFQQNTNNMQM